MNKKITKWQIIALIAIITLVLISTAAAIFVLNLPTTGIITSKNMKAEPDNIDWGFVTVGVSTVRTVTLTNTGNTPFSNLNMTVSNTQGLTDFNCTWNLEGGDLNPGESVTADFTLIINSYIIPTPLPPTLAFSFDIIIGE